MKNYKELFTNGIVRENPLLTLMIGLCSGLAITTSVENGIGMGLAMTFVLLMSELIISLFRKLIPSAVRIPIFIVVIASFTTIVDLMMKAFLPELSGSLGVFIPLIVVNCIIMGRVESFASKKPLDLVVFDSLGMGLGYAWVLAGISAVRELLGAGTLLGFRLIPESYTMGFFAKSPGGFFVFGMFIAVNMLLKKRLAEGGSAQ
ncbi:MAG TPA: electron transport complex subunit E [Treponemataceae bacterium]|jgi:electron transport complex protein RnfE|nr:MAG: Na(+)-translocating NADH-quinone reductase subunit D [Spirochaetes bacterium ADurb.Bin215]HOF84840.1 electron transport complex subunit E [Treponemataceae bacterium]HOU37884.1 electron transport complex subunit E [Treponemataceae bacterium]HPA09648.1 electron transport complex subunit E [Treponemataceae bacterium]HPL90701.1 electron transport complex subunit E [Treponemataceae bacterium]